MHKDVHHLKGTKMFNEIDTRKLLLYTSLRELTHTGLVQTREIEELINRIDQEITKMTSKFTWN